MECGNADVLFVCDAETHKTEEMLDIPTRLPTAVKPNTITERWQIACEFRFRISDGHPDGSPIDVTRRCGHNVLNGLFLKDVLLALKADGWFFEDAKTTLSMRGYHEVPPEPTKGRSWLTMEGKRRGVTPPPYPVEYRGFGRKTMEALGL